MIKIIKIFSFVTRRPANPKRLSEKEANANIVVVNNAGVILFIIIMYNQNGIRTRLNAAADQG